MNRTETVDALKAMLKNVNSPITVGRLLASAVMEEMFQITHKFPSNKKFETVFCCFLNKQKTQGWVQLHNCSMIICFYYFFFYYIIIVILSVIPSDKAKRYTKR